jgi:mutator protein MutT
MSHFQLLSASHLFLIKDRKILLTRRKGAWKSGFYSVPAGHLDGGETALEAMIREAKEEVGIVVERDDMHLVHTIHYKTLAGEYISFFFLADRWQGEPENLEPEKCDDVSWFPLDALPENTIPYIQQAIDGYRKGKTYSEKGWNGDAD